MRRNVIRYNDGNTAVKIAKTVIEKAKERAKEIYNDFQKLPFGKKVKVILKDTIMLLSAVSLAKTPIEYMRGVKALQEKREKLLYLAGTLKDKKVAYDVIQQTSIKKSVINAYYGIKALAALIGIIISASKI